MSVFGCPYLCFHPDKHRTSLIIQIKELTCSFVFWWVFFCLCVCFCRHPEGKKRIGNANCYNYNKKTTQWATGQPRPWKTK